MTGKILAAHLVLLRQVLFEKDMVAFSGVLSSRLGAWSRELRILWFPRGLRGLLPRRRRYA